jgi:integrase
MPRKLRAPKIENRTDRLKLAPRRKPYGFTSIAPGLRLGYRRNVRGAGTWVAAAADGKGGEETRRVKAVIDDKDVAAIADDFEAADGEHVLTFWQAADKARVMARGGIGKLASVAAALDSYEADLRARGGDIANATRVRHHLTPALLTKSVALLSGTELRHWRDDLIASGMASSTVVRTLNAAKAMLNRAADLDPKRINDRSPWQVGLASLPNTYTPINKVLTDSDVLRLVAESYALDPRFGLFVDVLASTGTRSSQACRLLVADLQADGAAPRLMMPSSRKGRGQRKITRKPVPIPLALARKLAQAAGDRAADAPLLTRADGAAWGSSNHRQLVTLFGEVARQVGITCTAYSLRHSSIVRMLLAGMPIRLVGSLHDTSVGMIERSYSAFVADHGDAVARRALLDTSEPAADSTIVRLRERR